ncbi:MAG: acyl-CoA dehydrogenase [Desulfobacterales bacterium]|nr:acyl-CoA dehydrogenase [Desulfobacterales bacterium]
MILLNPKNYDREYADEKSKAIMLKMIEFFETRGKAKLKQDDHDRVWYSDFLEFVKKEGIFSSVLTPSGYGDSDSRWDTYNLCGLNEIFGFYGLSYWYTWQVSILGLGPIWMSKNEKVKNETTRLLKEGAIFAFGLSEKEHGADIYSTDMLLTNLGNGKYVADGGKYYIGNGNKAAFVSIFGKDSDTNEYVFFVVDSSHKNYECVKNTINSQNYVAELALNSYPISDDDILARGTDAWDMALNTVNVGKFNLGWASIGICTHALYEAINHASSRKLYNKFVTDFPHIKQLFVDAYSRTVAMKLFSLRATDYMRAASPEDRRYLLYNPMVKMKVTTQGEEVINLLWDIIAAKGFEKDMYFEIAARDIRALPKLEGTVHVNMALIIKFMPNYFFNPGVFPEIPKRNDAANDSFLFNQGKTKGLSGIQFHDYNIAYNSVNLPNINIFKEQLNIFKEMLLAAPPSKDQTMDIDFLLIMGEVFTLVSYGQLIIENSKIYNVEDDLLDQIFDFMVRDFSKFALMLYSKPSSSDKQMEYCLKMVKKSANNPERFENIWKNHVFALKDVYRMNE